MSKYVYVIPVAALCVADAQPLVDITHQRGLLTGSRAFGVAHEYSDYDYVIEEERVVGYINFKRLTEYCGDKNFPTLGLKLIEAEGKWVDQRNQTEEHWLQQLQSTRVTNILITRTPAEHLAWRRATQAMCRLCEMESFRNAVMDKTKRIRVFESLRFAQDLV